MPKFILQTQPRSFNKTLASRLLPIQEKNAAKILITFDMGEALILGAKVRLIVYDLDDYLTSVLGEQESIATKDVRTIKGKRSFLWPFTNQDVGYFDALVPDAPLPEKFRDPPVGDGVLLKTDLVLRGQPAPAPEKGWWWWAEKRTPTQVPKADAAGQGLKVMMWKGPKARTGRPRLRSVGRVRYVKSDLTIQKKPLRKLVFRFIALEEVSDFLGPGSIFLSNLKAAQNTVARPLYVETSLLRTQLGLSPPPPEPKATLPAFRNLEPDLTGYWEEMPVDPLYVQRKGFIPSGYLSLNQAGTGRVGWYSPYSELGFTPFPNDEFNRPFSSERLVLRVYTKETKPGSKRFLFRWVVATKTAEDPSVLLFPSGSPAEDQLKASLHSGELRILDDLPDQIEIKLFGKAKDDGSVPEIERYFRRVSHRSRLPWFILRRLFDGPGFKNKVLAEEARRSVIAEQAEPIPVSFWIKVGSTVSKANWALRRAIDLFVENSSSASQVPRDIALRLVSQGGKEPSGKEHDGIVDLFRDAFWGRPKFASHHTQQIRTWIQTYAANNKIQASVTPSGQNSKPTKTVKAWLEDILFWALDYLVDHEEPFKGKPRADVYPKMVSDKANGWDKHFEGFILAGVQTRGVHKYKLHFFALKAGFEPKAGIGFTVGGFTALIEAEKNGAPRWNARYSGAFGGISAGLSIKPGKKLDPGGSTSGPPGHLEIESFYAFEDSDFKGAPFKIAALGGPSFGSAVPGTTVKTDSALFTITVERADGTEIDLSTVVEGFFEYDVGVPDVKDYSKKENDPTEFSLQLFSIGMTYGYLLFEGDKSGDIVPPDKDKPNRSVQTDPTEVSNVYFKVGSAAVDEEQFILLDGRLALYRRLIEEPGFIRTLGYVSPEWKGDKSGAKNLKLSQERATSAMNAVFGAVGSPGPLGAERIIYPHKTTKALGFGEDPATDPAKGGPLLDPENPERYVPSKMTQAEFDARLAREEPDYPSWRRVDLMINGLIVVRLKGK